ncbi:hypothetical protein BV22DRAFT_1134581 [Leucogyrophana mollusca]|uniref:Uncharacterized protein n=1 Tax=Leucogyrophana mollusca TaxID=85980 RepID=A0ACB8AZ77_9AGAM|nr:hypothetical protein BV22DRAFT_1134581 [Leucogyrophana mollusca]
MASADPSGSAFDSDDEPQAVFVPSGDQVPVTPSAARTKPVRSLQEDTPFVKRSSGSTIYSSTAPPQHKEAVLQLGAEMRYRFVGPMPPEAFLNAFLPIAQDPRPDCANIFDTVPQKGETTMYRPFIEAIEPFAPRSRFQDSSASVDPEVAKESLGLSPDVCVYHEDVNVPAKGSPDFSRMELFMEFKVNHSFDPFRDPPPKAKPTTSDAGSSTEGFNNATSEFENCTIDGTHTRNQIVAYATACQGNQFRHCVYSVTITGDRARLLRWDRSGTVVTGAFNWRTSHVLPEFLWRFSHASDHERGLDESVKFASAAEKRVAAVALQIHDFTNASFVKFEVDDPVRGKRYYIGTKPTFTPRSPIGRSTRGYPVYDLEKKKVCYLKDTWRVDMPGMVKEGDVYTKLMEHNVRHIAPLECAGDVHDHVTIAQDYVGAEWACRTKVLTKHRHYRLVLGVIGRDLTSFANTRELVSAVRDALQAHKDAFEKAEILHRDISVGNVIITAAGEGLLIDWDLAKSIADLNSSRQHERTGTWQFMAAALLHKDRPCHSLADDLESGVHVLTWVALRYTKNSLSVDPGALSDTLAKTYDESREDNGVFYGGGGKIDWLLRYTGTTGRTPVSFDDNPSLQRLIRRASALSAFRYDIPQEHEDEGPAELAARRAQHAAAVKALESTQAQALLDAFEKALKEPWPKAGTDPWKDYNDNPVPASGTVLGKRGSSHMAQAKAPRVPKQSKLL